MQALLQTTWNDDFSPSIQAIRPPSPAPQKSQQQLEFSGVFRGHELTRKDRRLSSGLAPLDALIGGGIPRGRISEITGRPGSGKTSIAASFASFATRRGEVAAWLDASGAFDPESMRDAGVELHRMLWASIPDAGPVSQSYGRFARPLARRQSAIVKAAELVLEAGGFGLVVVDFGDTPRALTQSSALRIARAAERSGAAVIAIAPWRMCGTFSALSLSTSRAAASFSRLAPGAPVTFDGIAVVAMVARNKMGGTGHSTRLRALIDSIEPLSIEPGVASASSTKPLDEKSILEKPALRIGSRGERR
ncbi:MAG: ATPase domain-containing protein [Candidatus Binatus sp.]|uniref:ATPase domain-containing protein n=1 Tax=Candidatus Binatus sp. TaxID=2811406 RepID=UPI00272457FB|nr:ATPase domain-containing protein [Candidatus Binatus sp.]MDO8433923.1 ATPase domain-containing protein [Candidatus Binatus sp.]